jgi:hypothetical protein
MRLSTGGKVYDRIGVVKTSDKSADRESVDLLLLIHASSHNVYYDKKGIIHWRQQHLQIDSFKWPGQAHARPEPS